MIKPLRWLSEKKKTITSISYLKIDRSLYNVWKTWNPFIQGCFATYLVEIDTVFLEKKTLTFCYFLLIPLGKGCGPSFEQCFELRLVAIGPVVSKEDENVPNLQTDGQIDDRPSK